MTTITLPTSVYLEDFFHGGRLDYRLLDTTFPEDACRLAALRQLDDASIVIQTTTRETLVKVWSRKAWNTSLEAYKHQKEQSEKLRAEFRARQQEQEFRLQQQVENMRAVHKTLFDALVSTLRLDKDTARAMAEKLYEARQADMFELLGVSLPKLEDLPTPEAMKGLCRWTVETTKQQQ